MGRKTDKDKEEDAKKLDQIKPITKEERKPTPLPKPPSAWTKQVQQGRDNLDKFKPITDEEKGKSR